MGKAVKKKALQRQARKQVEQHPSFLGVGKDQISQREEKADFCSLRHVLDGQQESQHPSVQDDMQSPLSETTIMVQGDQAFSVISSILLPSPVTSYEYAPSAVEESDVQKDEGALNGASEETQLFITSRVNGPKQWRSDISLDRLEANLRSMLEQRQDNHPDRGKLLHQLCVLLEKRGFIPQALEISNEVIHLLPERSHCIQTHQRLQNAMQSYSGPFDPVIEDERVKVVKALGVREGEQAQVQKIDKKEQNNGIQALPPFPRKTENFLSRHSASWQSPSSFMSNMTLTRRSGISKPLFNSTHEYRLYKVLIELFPLYIVYPNMALHSIFHFNQMKLLLDSEAIEYFLKAHVDVCLIRPSDYYPVVAIELDSKFHDTEKAMRKDDLKDQIFSLGGIDLLRLRPLEVYVV